MNVEHVPVLIIGSGIAGLLSALKLADAGLSSWVVTKTALADNSSWLAQGGIAAVLPENLADSVDLHLADTISAGAGLVDEALARSVIAEGHEAIAELLHLGVPFDRTDGMLSFTREGAHSTRRILHAGGDATGRSIQDTLIRKIRACPRVTVYEHCMATRLVVSRNRCEGAEMIGTDQQPMIVQADQTILATGGIGQLYRHTTNPAIATGDGIALAYEAGARIQDVEFAQFHPTAFWAQGAVQFLVSEALRGEGGILRNAQRQAFARDYHPDGDLAPRDIVTRAIFDQLQKTGTAHVFLDVTHLPAEVLEARFPTILKACLAWGVDIRTEPIPVTPAAHYGMGGVWVDPHGETSVQQLYAVGEVMCSGIHGANRLASNSLLECVVYARRVAEKIAQKSSSSPLFETTPHPPTSVIPPKAALERMKAPEDALKTMVTALRETMWQHVGVIRDRGGLTMALAQLAALEQQAEAEGLFRDIPEGITLRHMLTTSRLITQAALMREESRGAHWRSDFPQTLSEARHATQQLPEAERRAHAHN